jgi:uncharacterized membrane protein
MRKSLFVIAVAGLLVSGYLFVTYVTGAPIVCNTDHGCEIVRGSIYSSFFGIPTPAFGLLFYALLAIGALLWTPSYARLLRLPLALLTGIGVATSAYLTYLEAFVVEAWCSWCVVSAILTIAAFILVWFRGLRSPVVNIDRPAVQGASDRK